METTGAGKKERFLDLLGSSVDFGFLAVPAVINKLKPKRAISREEYERDIDFYIKKGFADDPASFFILPGNAPASLITDRKPYHDGEYQLISYESDYMAQNPFIRERYHSYAKNRTGYLVRWTHGDRGRKTVLCHHGYMLGEPRQARKMFRVKALFDLGLDVALFVAPFHWRRGSGRVSERGIYLQSDDAAMTCECVGQTIYDLYASYLIVRGMGAPEVGLIGASLGGHSVALFAALTDVASFAAMMVPAVNFTWPVHPDSARHRFRVDGPLRDKINRVWDLHSPLNLRPKMKGDRLLVVASRGDLLCPFENVRLLCDAWGMTDRHFLTGGHWLIFNRDERGRAWYGLLKKTGFIP
ncbi:MAG: hypothetical protein JXA07_16920 [Spirochaetes bacterium]|nr:hypothetical protein [Spirochaetota bacterium]